MNIGVNTRVLLSHRMEGVSRYIYETLRRMVVAHPEDQFFFFFDRPFDPQFVFGPNVTAITAGPQARHPFLWYLWFEHTMPRLLKKHNIDVFLSPDTYMSLKTTVPTVLISHDIAYAHYPEHIPYLHRRYYQKYFPKFHEAANRIVAVSNATKKDIVKTFKLDPTKVVVGHNSAPDYFYPFDDNQIKQVRDQYTDGKPYFVYVGAVHPRKNVKKIVQGFDQFKRRSGSDFKLMIVGRDAWNNMGFNRAMKKARYAKDIIWNKEYVEDIVPFVAASHALVYVSMFEGFGIPILEAMHCDVPVICSNLSSMPEVAGNAALLVNPHNAEDIASSMEYILLDDIRNQLISQGKIQREKFSWDRTAEIIHDQLHIAMKS